MNKKIRTGIGLLGFAALMIGAMFAFDRLQERADMSGNIGRVDALEGALAPTAYDFTVLDAAGNEVRLSDFFGMPIVINFWTTWCPACVQSTPHFDALYRQMGEEIHVLKVNLPSGRESRQVVDDFIAANGYTFPVYFDSMQEAAWAYGVRSIPYTVFINAEGHVSARILGVVNAYTLQEGIDSFN